MALSFLVLGAFAAQSMATMLYNGLQTQIFSSDLRDIIQLTTYGIQAVYTDTSDFCLDVEQTCVTYLDLRCFLADSVGSWNIIEMVLNEVATWPSNTYNLFDFEWSDATGAAGSTQLAALDYYIERGDSIDDDNYGWALPLEFDEYPLEIQCSFCFLQTFKYGLENKWGDIWERFVPRSHARLLLSTWEVIWNNNTENIVNWVAGFSNLTLARFYTWNPYINLDHVTHGTVVCVGPPGGVYIPPRATVATPSVYTATAIPASPTPFGTIANCSPYEPGFKSDDCSLVSEKYGLAFPDFINLNPSIDSACSNLILGDDYCVAAVNGTVVSSVTTTKAPATSTSKSSPTGTSYVAAPSATAPGTTPYCYTWYTVFYAWNPAMGACANLWPGYYYCVGM
ncbi:hypothetical protein BDZ45DRAFT_799471 [Acephala macrosclerotiorum]|nr:hypothetical protein BDZ45DRAFT_799471 [Acephala macrosclerotiorum]